MSSLSAKLGIGPMSPQIVEAVFRYSENSNQQLMLIASKNQIDWSGGYVSGWNTERYMQYVAKMKKKYPLANVLICRDHCGPGFTNGGDLQDAYKTIDCDIDNGFDLIHVDFCRYNGSHEDIITEAAKAIDYIKSRNNNIKIEVGTDDNKGEFLESAEGIEKEMEYFSRKFDIDFFVFQTGSLVKEVNQVGSFNEIFVRKIREIANKYNIKLKEHNCDYLDSLEISKRKNLVDAVNVAPQYGVMQTNILLAKSLAYGIDINDFIRDAYASKKWTKWMMNNDANNKYLCALIAGHYIQSFDSYKKLVNKINKHENFDEVVIDEMMKNFDLYINNLK